LSFTPGREAGTKTGGTDRQGWNERKEGGRLREAARCVTKRGWFLFWRDTGALARAAVRASIRGAHPNGVEVDKIARSRPETG
jgi:hypothetical protein